MEAINPQVPKEGIDMPARDRGWWGRGKIHWKRERKEKASVILSNMPGAADGKKTNDTYANQRQQIRDAGASVVDRFMPSGRIGHNKFQVLNKDGPQAVLFGSTNWTSNALSAQTNNSIIARSPLVAAAYKEYWDSLKADTDPQGEGGKAQQSSNFRDENAKARPTITLEDGSGTVDLWFSPNTAKARGKAHGKNESVPPDLKEVFDIIAKAQQAILFLAFQPGSPSIIDAISEALKSSRSDVDWVRGTLTIRESKFHKSRLVPLHPSVVRVLREIGETPPAW